VEGGVPESLRQLIEQQLERLGAEEQHVLEAASVAGVECSVTAMAAGLEEEGVWVEKRCEVLARREQFLRASGIEEWPDGTVSGRYGFQHVLYQHVLYERIAEARRIRLHRLIGERIEVGYGDRAGQVAAELAIHFERGYDFSRAVQYLQQAGENATRQSAPHEAIKLLTKGLELLKTLPDTPERAQQELVLQTALGSALIATQGYAAADVEHAYTRARELCQQAGTPSRLFGVLLGLWSVYSARADLQAARELAEQLLTLAQRVHYPSSLLWAHYVLGITLFSLGELDPARTHLEQGMGFYDPQHRRSPTLQDPGVSCLSYTAWVLWHLGYADQALRKNLAALTLAQELSHPFSLAYAHHYAAIVHQIRGERQAAQESVETLMKLSNEQGFAHALALGTILQGWVLANQGQGEAGIVQIRQGLAAYRDIEAEIARPYYLALLAEVCGKVRRAREGLNVLAEALAAVNKTREHFYEAELYRLKGELLLAQEGKNQKPVLSLVEGAEECFQKAIDIARRQSAKSLELRAVMSLSRLWQRQGKKEEARQMLAEIYGWFTEGFDTVDLKEGKALLEELSEPHSGVTTPRDKPVNAVPSKS
jgi:predicted ATPase